jgi:hypothetical protein
VQLAQALARGLDRLLYLCALVVRLVHCQQLQDLPHAHQHLRQGSKGCKPPTGEMKKLK